MDKNLFTHTLEQKVKFHEVDLMGITNNAVYFNYFEDSRIRYVQDLKQKYKLNEIMEGYSFFIMAHNESDYLEPSFFDEELIVYTRVSFIKNTSFGYEHIIENKKTGRIIVEGSGVVVHINLETRRPLQIPEEFYTAVQDYEKEVKILRKKG